MPVIIIYHMIINRIEIIANSCMYCMIVQYILNISAIAIFTLVELIDGFNDSRRGQTWR